MAREIGIGLLGVGWMGEVHSTSYRRVPIHFPECEGRARLVVAADEVEERARAAAHRLGYERSTTDWREVIADAEVEAVSICAPNFLHREMAVAAAESGKHFWGEKPLGALPEDTAEIARTAERTGVRTIVGLNYRNPPAVQHAKRLLDDGALGVPNHFRMQFLASYSANPRGALSWRFSRALAGHGILSDLGSHAVDLAQFLLGPIVRVTAASAILIPRRPKVSMGTGTHFSVVEGDVELGDVENDDWCAALVELESGLRGTIELSRVTVGAEARYRFEINGTEGAVAWDFERMNELEVYRDGGNARVLMGPSHPDFARFQPGRGIPMGYDDLKVIEAYRFLQSVADGRQREPGAREMAAAARVVDAITRSCESGRWEPVRS
ncbi:MAG: Gfo/Idh/MocA family oxidoreductase [Actinomycetota bacterium]|nr:Gfo/Idh/MocA family oxidoreductase [Actinomycetota bacterium]